MSILKLQKILITDEDIEWVESLIGDDIIFNSSQKNAIKNLNSVDIQAFPGSGKTTTLVAKLAILAKKWPFTNCGMCVLSHTNVARNEIENRLGNTPEGAKLLTYPHFVGTLHSFFDSFVSLPWLKSNGICINVINTDYVKEIRWKKLSTNTKIYFQRNNKDKSICGFEKNWEEIPWDKNGKTRDELMKIIKESQEKGNYTYNELLLLAKKILIENPHISDGIEERFPILFIDEAQDTNSLLWELIMLAFPKSSINSIRQGFGDSNQAIYNYFNESIEKIEFPRSSYLILSESKRFDDRIASLANKVAISSEYMHGTSNKFTKQNVPHTIFLFNDNTIKDVIEEFAKLILISFSDEDLSNNANLGCHVIGMIHNKTKETSDKNFPKGIYDYWPNYIVNEKNDNELHYIFIDYYRHGKLEYNQSGKYSDLIDWLVKGIRRIINNAANKNIISPSGNVLYNIEIFLSYDSKLTFRSFLYELSNSNIVNEEQWNNLKLTVQKILLLFDLSSNINVEKFMKWKNYQLCDEKLNEKHTSNSNHYIYHDIESGRSVDLEFGSIHSIKGCTHFATLILETFLRAHNIKSILKYLCSNQSKSKISKANASRLKCQYVAMTRPKALLCMAIPAKFIDKQKREQLIKAGWRIKDV